jgi:hypothetical protein
MVMRVSRELKLDVNKVVDLLLKQDLFGKIVCQNGTEKNIKISGIATNGRYLSVYYNDPSKNETVDVSPLIRFEK